MTEPANEQEYLKLYQQNHKIDGFGIGNVYNHFPCPFCAAPDWMVTELLQVEAEMQKDHICKNCGRSAKAIVTRTSKGVSFEVVQTGGDDPPDWLTPKMRRV